MLGECVTIPVKASTDWYNVHIMKNQRDWHIKGTCIVVGNAFRRHGLYLQETLDETLDTLPLKRKCRHLDEIFISSKWWHFRFSDIEHTMCFDLLKMNLTRFEGIWGKWLDHRLKLDDTDVSGWSVWVKGNNVFEFQVKVTMTPQTL